LAFERQRSVPVVYKGEQIECGYRLDLVVEGTVLVELKTVDRLMPVHIAQAVTYLRLSGIAVGLLVNFNAPLLKDGLRRLWLPSQSSFPPTLPVFPNQTSPK
jgi:GxxExxY protein